MNKLIKSMVNIVLRGKADSDSYIKHLRKIGVKVGKNVTVFSPHKCEIDEQNPHMLEIGDNVKILAGVTILTHDFSWCVTSGIDGVISGAVGKVVIGNNVFISRQATILRNTVIGNNVIIGVGSVVTKDCEPNSVYAGIPAKKIMSMVEFHNKRKKAQLEEAKQVVIQYHKRTGKIPSKEILREYIFLYETRDIEQDEIVRQVLIDSGHYAQCLSAFKNTEPQFNGFSSFLKYCGLESEES